MIVNNILPYRLGVGAMILNKDKKVFIAKRVNSKSESWQMPQGGIDETEDPRQAIFREVYEEIGTDKISIIVESTNWLTYDVPYRFASKFWRGKFRGQKQKWYLLNFTGNDTDFNLETHIAEFSEWKWIEVADLILTVIDFKKELYRQILYEFKDYI